jgi:hypothetical protein
MPGDENAMRSQAACDEPQLRHITDEIEELNRMVLKVLSSIACGAVLVALPALQVGARAPALPASQAPPTIEASGLYIHPASKLQLPVDVGRFRRQSIHQYDAAGTDISAGYNFVAPGKAVAATVYIYPGSTVHSGGSPANVVADAKARLTQAEFLRREREIVAANPSATLIDQQDVTHTENGHTYLGKMAFFDVRGPFAGQIMDLNSRLYVFCFVDDSWAIEYRFTYPRGVDVDADIKSFIASWNWHKAS